MLDDVGSPNFKLLWDAAHYYDPGNVNDIPGLLMRMYASFGTDVVIAHANDFRVTPEGKVASCGIGEGRLDYATYIDLLESCRREMLLAVEHTPEADVWRVKTCLDPYFV
jgi:sugar phosphate isomerase/epimerase